MVEQRFCKAKAIGSNPLAGIQSPATPKAVNKSKQILWFFFHLIDEISLHKAKKTYYVYESLLFTGVVALPEINQAPIKRTIKNTPLNSNIGVENIIKGLKNQKKMSWRIDTKLASQIINKTPLLSQIS